MAKQTIILTDHARERMMVRRISQRMIQQTLENPQGSEKEDDGDTQFYRTLDGRRVHVVAKPLERNEWLIKTVWVKGEEDPSPLVKFGLTWLARVLTQLRK